MRLGKTKKCASTFFVLHSTFTIFAKPYKGNALPTEKQAKMHKIKIAWTANDVPAGHDNL